MTADWLEPDIEQPLISTETTEALGMVELLLENFANYPEFLKELSGTIIKMIEADDWRLKYTGLMTLSQIAEYVPSIGELEPVILVLFSYVRDDHPAIKAACFHCLGQFCIDLKPEFQKIYCAEIFEACNLGLQDKVLVV